LTGGLIQTSVFLPRLALFRVHHTVRGCTDHPPTGLHVTGRGGLLARDLRSLRAPRIGVRYGDVPALRQAGHTRPTRRAAGTKGTSDPNHFGIGSAACYPRPRPGPGPDGAGVDQGGVPRRQCAEQGASNQASGEPPNTPCPQPRKSPGPYPPPDGWAAHREAIPRIGPARRNRDTHHRRTV